MFEFLPYQKRFGEAFLRGDGVIVYEKSRRIGATWYCAAMCVAHAAAGDGNVFYLSYEKQMTREFVDAAAEHARALEKVDVRAQEDADSDTLIFEMRFASGRRLRSMTGSARNFRGKGSPGTVFVIDEAAFVDDLPALMKAALAVRVWGGRLVVMSTHNGADSEFNAMVRGIREGRLPYTLLRTTFDEAVQDGLYKRVCAAAGRPWSEAAQESWQKEIYAEYGEDADEELRVIPARGGGLWLERALIQRAMDLPAERGWPAERPLRLRWPGAAGAAPAERAKDMRAYIADELRPWLQAGLAQERGAVFLGWDFALTGDLSSLCVLRTMQDGALRAGFFEMSGVPYDQQLQAARAAAVFYGRLPDRRLGGMAIDGRGNGTYAAGSMRDFLGAAAQDVQLTEKWYREEMPPLKAALEQHKLALPPDADTMNDLRAIRLAAGVPRLPAARAASAADKKMRRHGDNAIALALACYAMRQNRGATLDGDDDYGSGAGANLDYAMDDADDGIAGAI